VTGPVSARYVHLVRRPRDGQSAADFGVAEQAMPDPGPGTALVANLYLSVDPYMRALMDEDWPLHAPLEGRAIGRVISSRDNRLAPGDLVLHRQGWRTHAVVAPEQARILAAEPRVPLSTYLGILGGTGRTAYAGLTRVARLRPGETVFISAAAGGVGSAAGQLARLLGAGRVVGSAGSAAKVRHLIEDLGFDAAFDYHHGPVTALLAQAAPDGIDVCLDNVGGEHLEAALDAMRPYGRIAWSGAIARYAGQAPAPRNLIAINHKNLRLEGFFVGDYDHLQGDLEDLLIPLIADGRLTPDETIIDGFEHLVDAFLGLFRGANTGKTIVHVLSSTEQLAASSDEDG
jgi:NADPH-dependent curcumin reductase CurA